MSHEDFDQELNALRETLPTVVEETTGGGKSKTAVQLYSIGLAERIVDYYTQGLSLQSIAQKGEMPSYGTLLKWSKHHPEFSKMLRAVREARAIHFENKAIQEAEDLSDPKEANMAKVKIDTYKWAAEVNDPSIYGKKIEHKGDLGGGGKVIIQVVTGFGPLPPALQFPKLNADGTICKDVQAEVANGAGHPGSDQKADTPGENGSAQQVGLPDTPGSSERGGAGGVQPLQPESGHTPEPGSEKSP